VPADSPEGGVYSSSLQIADDDNARHAPEYVHARRMMDGNQEVDLNEEENVEQRVEEGDYDAVHFVDYTGDGWVAARCPQLRLRSLSAYSVVTAPDFFPNVDERELVEWTAGLPVRIRERIWNTAPHPLSEERLAVNINLSDARFDPDDVTLTAIVAKHRVGPVRELEGGRVEDNRHCWLPDGASGVFAPGWDTSFDRTRGTEHLAAYGLGSPFPEDAKLCAALSTFWPAVAPDAARTFEPGWGPTVSPLTDEEIGINGQSWDGVPGPVRRVVGGERVVEYHDFAHADYVLNALDGKFSLALTGRIDGEEYRARVFAMARIYRAVRPAAPRAGDWVVLSFRKVSAGNAELLAATQAAGSAPLLAGRIFRAELFRPGEEARHPNDVRKVRVPILDEATVFIDEERFLLRRGAGQWIGMDG
jgi:hypothetical protein